MPNSSERPIDIVRCQALLASFVSYMQVDGVGTCANCVARLACQLFRCNRQVRVFVRVARAVERGFEKWPLVGLGL